MVRKRNGRINSLGNLQLFGVGPSGDNGQSRNDHDSVDIQTDTTWQDGRRVVELGLLATQMKCACGNLLHLRDTRRETRQGLGSILYIVCGCCDTETAVPTGKRHSSAGPARIFDINTKMAAAMVNAGVGQSQINNILAELNLPPICPKTLKKREREIGNTIETVSEESCNRAIEEELEMIRRLNSLPSTSTATVLAEAGLDGGWQKRGTGRCRNSLSGHVTVIGRQRKKVLGFGVAKKHCSVCSYHSRYRTRPRIHQCRRNWNGSAKAMEPFLAVNCLIRLKAKGFDVKRIIMDDDTTTLTRARQCVSSDIEKSSDSNHVIKNFTGALIGLKNKHSIGQLAISKFSKDFSYALKQNENDTMSLKGALSAIVPHAFGDHNLCGDQKWCKYDEQKENYRHKQLPHGSDLKGESLRNDLQELLNKYMSVPMLSKLSTLQSTNCNENMNQIIARKAPKSLHYSGSESLDYRVSAAVSQKNDGSSYMVKVNEKHNLSPGKFTKNRFERMDMTHNRKKRPLILWKRRDGDWN